MIGFAQNDPAFLRRGADYLDNHKKNEGTKPLIPTVLRRRKKYQYFDGIGPAVPPVATTTIEQPVTTTPPPKTEV